jgi:hypothetical protein
MSKPMVRSRPRSPEALHQLVRHRGLEACTDLIAAATPEQVMAVLDLDLWRAPRAGLDDHFDAGRFAEWLEALVAADAAVAARIVAGLEPNLVITGLSRLVRVFDLASGVAPAAPVCLEGDVGGYLLRAAVGEPWDAIVALLNALESDHPGCFHALMCGVRRLSSSTPEVDGLDQLLVAPDQSLHDAALDREQRRAEEGFCTPADARAFLQLARHRGRTPAVAAPNPIAAAYVRGAGAHGGPELEFAFLTNTLVAGCSIGSGPFTPHQAAIAVAATCRLGRERLPTIASPDVPASAGLGLVVGDRSIPGQPLVAAFEAGWAALHREVCLVAAERLIAVLGDLRIADTASDRDLQHLRRELIAQHAAGTPWRARDALDIVATLDQLAWIALLGILDECPSLPEALTAIVERRTGAVSATALAFISTSAQIDTVARFLSRLPEILGS